MTGKIEIITPQFERTDGIAVPPAVGVTEWFDELKDLTKEELLALGCHKWDGDLWLYPAEWYDHIPDGYPMVDIFKKEVNFKAGVTDSDQRFGALPYGFIKP